MSGSAPRRARPRRALLFCPGTERRKLEKAAALEVDTLVIDLEDAAALARKAEARATTVAALEELDFGRSEVLVRINPVGSGLEWDDLGALEQARRLPDGLMLPKVAGASDIRAVSAALGALEARRGVEPGALRLLAIVESARGVVNLAEIAAADPRLDALVFGAEDLAGDIGATRSLEGWEVFFAMSAVVIHAAAFGLQAIDTPFVELHDEERLVAVTRRALAHGFTGKLAIHPKQVGPISEVFTPTAEEVAAAERLIAFHDRHQGEGRGVFELDGKMIDMPMVRAAQRVLARRPRAGGSR
jgi:citrate lyase beta subunit